MKRKAILVGIIAACLAVGAYATTIETESLPGFYVGVPASFQIQATGTAPITFQITSGSLPPGLSMSSGGVISGTPTVATYDYTIFVRATDANGRQSTTTAYAVMVEP
ncbi:MAG TPA: Ig domain-containing protein [Thermoanaerobaculia bacterium]|nr:Ig domain-containing protein [Thermoanaerobaculia bacterium]